MATFLSAMASEAEIVPFFVSNVISDPKAFLAAAAGDVLASLVSAVTSFASAVTFFPNIFSTKKSATNHTAVNKTVRNNTIRLRYRRNGTMHVTGLSENMHNILHTRMLVCIFRLINQVFLARVQAFKYLVCPPCHDPKECLVVLLPFVQSG